jgi:DNA-binding transcriptional regulator GbsR (MarR family)
MYLKVVVKGQLMNQDQSYEAAKRHIIDASVKCAKISGYSDACGVLRGTILLSGNPLSLDELVGLTGYSKSTVCLNMNLLENLGLAKRVLSLQDKRSRYEIVSDTNSMKTIMISNIKKEVQLILHALDLTEKEITSCKADSEEIAARITKMKRVYNEIDALITLIDKYKTEELIDLLGKSTVD